MGHPSSPHSQLTNPTRRWLSVVAIFVNPLGVSFLDVRLLVKLTAATVMSRDGGRPADSGLLIRWTRRQVTLSPLIDNLAEAEQNTPSTHVEYHFKCSSLNPKIFGILEKHKLEGGTVNAYTPTPLIPRPLGLPSQSCNKYQAFIQFL